jgi:hypothetical protein
MVGGVIRSPAANKIDDKKEVISDKSNFSGSGESEFKLAPLSTHSH